MKWFGNSLRPNLIGIHISNWMEEFLSHLSTDDYYKSWKNANVKSTMIYLQLQVGYCYYPSKAWQVHSAFKNPKNTVKKHIKPS